MLRALPVLFLACAAAHAPAAQPAPFVQDARLVPASAPSDGQFGRAVALSGDRLLVSSDPTACTPETARGVHVFARTTAGWAEEAELMPATPVCFWTGARVALEGDVAVLGRVDDVAGEVYVFERSAAGWVQTATLVRPGAPLPPDAGGDGFGWSLALDSGRVLVGSFVGATLFERDGAGWTAGTPLIPDAPGLFGHAVALDGDRALVGGFPDAVVMRETPAGWVQDALLTTDGSRDPTTGVFSVTLDGGLAAVGRADQNGARGLASVFSHDGGAWTREPFLSDAGARAFGHAVALDGPDLLVGAYLSNAAFRFERRGGAWVPAGRLEPEPTDGVVAGFGVGVALDAGRAAVGAYRADGPTDPDPFDGTGAAYVFSGIATSVEAAPAVSAAMLSAPVPNPATDAATLTLRLSSPAPVRAVLVDALGRTVRAVFDGVAGETTVLRVDVAGLPAGVYAVRVMGGAASVSERLTVAR